MEKRHRSAIRANALYLQDNLLITPKFLACLYAENVLTSEMQEDFIEVTGNSKRSVRFCSLIQKRGPRAFPALLRALRTTGQGFIAEKLESCLIKNELSGVAWKCKERKSSTTTYDHHALPTADGLVQEILDTCLDLEKSENAAGPLHAAVDSGRAKALSFLIEKGCNASNVDSAGQTLLHRAVRAGGVEVIEMLLEKGCPCNVMDNANRTPLHIAWMSGHNDIAALLIKSSSCDLSTMDRRGRTMLYLASNFDDLESVKLLLERTSDVEKIVNQVNEAQISPLHWASYNGNRDLAWLLINCGAVINAKSDVDCTPLHWACMNGQSSVIETLLEHGCNVNFQDGFGRTPLHWASDATQNAFECVSMLLEYNADANIVDISNCTPLHLACGKGNNEVISLLARKGVSISACDSSGRSPLHWACDYRRSDSVALLLQLHCTVDAPDSSGLTPLHLAAHKGNMGTIRLLEKANVNALDCRGRTPLHHACANGHRDVVEQLLCMGSSLTIADRMGHTALHEASFNGHSAVAAQLIEKGACVNARKAGLPERNKFWFPCMPMRTTRPTTSEHCGCTPLHDACLKGHTAVARHLVKHGADVFAQTDEGFTPLYFVCIKGNLELCSVLLGRADVAQLRRNVPSLLQTVLKHGHSEIADLLRSQCKPLVCDQVFTVFKGNTSTRL